MVREETNELLRVDVLRREEAVLPYYVEVAEQLTSDGKGDGGDVVEVVGCVERGGAREREG